MSKPPARTSNMRRDEKSAGPWLPAIRLAQLVPGRPERLIAAALACFVLGGAAGIIAFTGDRDSLKAEAIFILSYLAGLALLARVKPGNQG